MELEDIQDTQEEVDENFDLMTQEDSETIQQPDEWIYKLQQKDQRENFRNNEDTESEPNMKPDTQKGWKRQLFRWKNSMIS